MPKSYYVYIMANHKNGTLYVGMTNSIAVRSTQHREGEGAMFTAEHRLRRLVYMEEHADVRETIAREKRLKRWDRAWKIALIEQSNPEWRDLWFDLNR